jgi:hypothetical protein
LGAAALVTLAVTLVLQIGSGAAKESRMAANCGTAALGVNVGSVTNLVHTVVWKNETQVTSAPSVLRLKNWFCTGSEGQALIRLTRTKTTNCNVYPRNRMQLYPSTSLIIQFYPSTTRSGRSWCSTSRGKAAWYAGTTGRTRLYTTDPVFATAVTPRTTTVYLTYGFFAVYAARTRDPVVLGPLQQVLVTAEGVVGGPGSFAPTAADRRAIAALGQAVPRPNYTRPPAGSSTVLARMYERGDIGVGIERGVPPEVADFTRRYFRLLAQRWKLDLVLVADASPEALAEGRIDVAVTPTREEGAVDVEQVPFTEHREPWDLEVLPEPDLVSGLRRYVRTALESGDYATHYRAAFAAEPGYDRFRDFLFPSLPASPP